MKDKKRELDMSMVFNRIENLELKVHSHDKRLDVIETKEEENREDISLIHQTINTMQGNIEQFQTARYSDNIRIISISIVIFSITLILFKLIGL